MEIEESLVVIIVEKYEKANRFLIISKRSALSDKSFFSLDFVRWFFIT